MSVSISKTEEYYRTLCEDDLCSCAGCRNYYKEIKIAYPALSEYLNSMGIDIEKPFEAMPLDPYKGSIEYSGVQYIVMGDPSGFESQEISGVRIEIADSHPVTDIADEHFVIELWPITLRYTESDNWGK